MIVRIMGEGQYHLSDDLIDRLNALDDQLEDAVDHHDEMHFREILENMLELVRTEGKPVEADELAPSDAILPSDDTNAAELRELLKEEGFIPG